METIWRSISGLTDGRPVHRNMLELSEEPLDARIITFLNEAPVNDGGQFDMAVNILEVSTRSRDSLWPATHKLKPVVPLVEIRMSASNALSRKLLVLLFGTSRLSSDIQTSRILARAARNDKGIGRPRPIRASSSSKRSSQEGGDDEAGLRRPLYHPRNAT